MSDTFNPQTIEQAFSQISRGISAVSQSEVLSLKEAGGRILAREITSPKDMPDAPLSAMDGYSFDSTRLDKGHPEKELALPVLGKSLAGHSLSGKANPQCACRIFTGAVVPPSHDTVIAQELVKTDTDQRTVQFASSAVKAKANVRGQGEDLRRGARALPRGALIGAREVALLASIGIASVEVVRKIRVAVLSTGDEVEEPGRPLASGKIFDANRPMLLELIRSCNATAIDLGIVKDDAESLRSAISQAGAVADAVITSGGVSVGEADHTKEVMRSLGDISFWKLAIKPGRPLAAGWINPSSNSGPKIPFFGLPGNPVAAFVTFKSIVGPCLSLLAGSADKPRPAIRARLARATRKTVGRTEYLRCTLLKNAAGEWIADIAASQGAASLKSLTDADGLVVLPHDSGPLEADAMVDVLVL